MQHACIPQSGMDHTGVLKHLKLSTASEMMNATNNPVNLSLQMKHAPGVTTTCKQTILFSCNTQNDTCMHTCTHVDARMHACTHVDARMHTCTHVDARMHAHKLHQPSVEVSEKTQECKHACTRIYTVTHARMHACTHYVSYIMYSLNAVYTCQCIQHNCALSNI